MLRAGVVHRVRSLAPDALVVVHNTWAGDRDLAGSDLARCPGRAASERRAAGRPTRGAGRPSRRPPVSRPRSVRGGLRVPRRCSARRRAGRGRHVARSCGSTSCSRSERTPSPSSTSSPVSSLNVFGNYLALDRLDRSQDALRSSGRWSATTSCRRSGRSRQSRARRGRARRGRGRPRRPRGGRAGRLARRSGTSGSRLPTSSWSCSDCGRPSASVGSVRLRLATLRELGGAEEIVRAHLERALGEGSRRGAGRGRTRLQPSRDAVGHEGRSQRRRPRRVRERAGGRPASGRGVARR